MESAMESAISNTVTRALPEVAEVLEVVSHFDSAWAKCFKVTIQHNDDSEEEYFMKISIGEAGAEALKGEFEATSLIYSFAPDFCPKPVAHGDLEEYPDAHFYMCEFLEFSEGVPAAKSFCKKLADLHKNHKSPEGKFGFHVTTYNGDLPQKNTWCDSWETFFAAGLKHILEVREKRAGPHEELNALLPYIFDEVIPRLLRPLESEGREVIPSFVHGDLWCGNAAIIDDKTEAGVVYDPASFWAHNEYELGNWRPARNNFRGHIDEYLEHYAAAEPKEDFDKRNHLYSLRFNCNGAALFPYDQYFMDLVIQDVKELIAKCAEEDPADYPCESKLSAVHVEEQAPITLL